MVSAKQKPSSIGIHLGIRAAVKRGFSIKRQVTLNPALEIIDAKSKKHIGYVFVKRIVKKPEAEKKLVAEAWERFNASIPEVDKLKAACDDLRVPLKKVIDLYHQCFFGQYESALDRVFDWGEYQKQVKSMLRKEYPSFEDDLIETLSCPDGSDSYFAFKQRVLQHLAQKFGRHRQEPGAYSFSSYNWDWFRENYVTLKNRGDAFLVSEDLQKKRIARVMRDEGIKEGDYKAVIHAMENVKWEMFRRKIMRKKAAERIVRYTSPEAKPAVRALLDFAGQAKLIDERMHVTTRRAMNLVMIAAEKRGVPRDKLMIQMLEAL